MPPQASPQGGGQLHAFLSALLGGLGPQPAPEEPEMDLRSWAGMPNPMRMLAFGQGYGINNRPTASAMGISPGTPGFRAAPPVSPGIDPALFQRLMAMLSQFQGGGGY